MYITIETWQIIMIVEIINKKKSLLEILNVNNKIFITYIVAIVKLIII